jgi:hypothetical protein
MKKNLLSFGLAILTSLIGFQAQAQNGIHYIDPNGFSFDYASSWKMDPPADQSGQIRMTPRREPFFTFLLRYDKRPHSEQPENVDAFVEQVCLPVISHTEGVEILEKWKTKIDGKDAGTVLYSIPQSKAQAKMRYKAIILLDSGMYYWFTFGGEDGSFERYAPDAEKTVATFKLRPVEP